MKRTLPFSLGALTFILMLGLALSLSFSPTLAQGGATPTPDPAGDPGDTGGDMTEGTEDTDTDMGETDAATGDTGAGDTAAQPGGPVFVGGDESSPAAQTVLNYFQTFDPNLLADTVQYRDFTQQQALTTREDITGAANYLNTAFSDQDYTIHRVLIADNTVVVEFDFSGTNTGAFMGAEPTQQTVSAPMVAIIELGADAQQIVRFDLYYDASALARQLGFTLQGPQTDEMTDDDDMDGADGEMDDATGLAPAISVEDQMISDDGTVLVAQVTSPVSGWVDIHADNSGAPGTIIGYAQVAAGETLNVPVPIDGNQVTATLWAMLHEDAGEAGVHEFPGPDAPVTDAQGNVVVVPFSVTAPGDAAQSDDAGMDDASDDNGEEAVEEPAGEPTEEPTQEAAEGAGS